MSANETTLVATILSMLDDSQRQALAAALAKLAESQENPEPAPPTAEPLPRVKAALADARAVAREIVATVMKGGKIWARRQWWTPRLCNWAGHLLYDRRGTKLFCLTCAAEDSDAVICKKVRDDGTVYGQSVVRSVEREIVKDAGEYREVKADVSVLRQPREATARKPAGSQPKAAPAPSPEPAAEPATIAVPDGATHLVIVQPDGNVATFSGTGDAIRLDMRGKAAKAIVAGTHRNWSPRIANKGFSVRFDCGGEAC